MTCKNLDELFAKIRTITGVGDIGYHEIRDGRLNPVHKTNTDALGVEKWKSTHAERPVYIEKTPILKELLNTGKASSIANTKSDSRSDDAFFLFGIDSILIIPVVQEECIKGIICIASIGKLHEFSKEEINECTKAVNKHFNS
ncbi:MAG: GAF domain-containing protein [Clostridia bacterium]|nr:GAF domain-containing protein [Clostridia bacterium]